MLTSHKVISANKAKPDMRDFVRAVVAPGPMPAEVLAEKHYRVRAFVCPYGALNVYGEGMERGAFDEFVARLDEVNATSGGYAIPMHLMHIEEALVGAWTRLWTTSEGLWAEGLLHRRALPVIEADNMRDISMSWASADITGPYKVTRARWEQRLDAGDRLPSQGVEIVPKVIKCEGVGMNEISIVDKGAFEGTHWEIIGGKVT